MNHTVVAGFLACMMLGQQVPAEAGQQKPGQQAIPDAPAPQALPIGSVRPGIGSTPTSTGNDTSAPQEQAPASSLSSATPTPQDQQDAGPPPTGEDVQAFKLVVPVNFVEVPVTVKDKHGQLVPGLTWRDFRIYENGLRQQMRLFTVDPFPLSVAIVIDQSLTFDAMTRVNNALGALQGAFAPYDEVAVFTYNNGPRLQTTFTGGQSPRLNAILERSKSEGREPLLAGSLSGPLAATTNINNQNFDPNTAPIRNQMGIQLNAPRDPHTLNDAILAAAEETTKAGRGRRRVVYVISDGKEYGSTAKYKDVVKYLQANNIQVFATDVGSPQIKGLGWTDRIHLPFQMRDNILPLYVGATGGQIDYEFRTPSIARSFAKIAEQVRTQYTIGYYSHEPFIDGKYRRIEVRVLRPDLTVIAKPGYFPTAENLTPNTVSPQ